MPRHRHIILLALLLVSVFTRTATASALDYSGPKRQNAIIETTLIDALAPFLGIPYREDGVIDEQGQYILFEHPETVINSPGLNCSGLVVAAGRTLLHANKPLANLTRDRNNDSGPDAPLGLDWDYGLDLILNISEELERRQIMPEGALQLPGVLDQARMRGFNATDKKAWDAVQSQLRQDRVYLLSFNRLWHGRVHHHHVGLLLVDMQGRNWLYQATRRSGVIRTDIRSASGFAAYRKLQLLWTDPQPKVLLLEVAPPFESP